MDGQSLTSRGRDQRIAVRRFAFGGNKTPTASID
jgi:hypothetical protein